MEKARRLSHLQRWILEHIHKNGAFPWSCIRTYYGRSLDVKRRIDNNGREWGEWRAVDPSPIVERVAMSRSINNLLTKGLVQVPSDSYQKWGTTLLELTEAGLRLVSTESFEVYSERLRQRGQDYKNAERKNREHGCLPYWWLGREFWSGITITNAN